MSGVGRERPSFGSIVRLVVRERKAMPFSLLNRVIDVGTGRGVSRLTGKTVGIAFAYVLQELSVVIINSGSVYFYGLGVDSSLNLIRRLSICLHPSPLGFGAAVSVCRLG